MLKGTAVSSLNFGNRLITFKKAALNKLATLTSVIFGENAIIKQAEDEAFTGTSLTTVQIPAVENVSKFGNGVFGGISTLESFTLAENNTVHEVVDGVLYLKDGENLILIQVPAGYFRPARQCRDNQDIRFRGGDGGHGLYVGGQYSGNS